MKSIRGVTCPVNGTRVILEGFGIIHNEQGCDSAREPYSVARHNHDGIY
jgi:hypothetical protein